MGKLPVTLGNSPRCHHPIPGQKKIIKYQKISNRNYVYNIIRWFWATFVFCKTISPPIISRSIKLTKHQRFRTESYFMAFAAILTFEQHSSMENKIIIKCPNKILRSSQFCFLCPFGSHFSKLYFGIERGFLMEYFGHWSLDVFKQPTTRPGGSLHWEVSCFALCVDDRLNIKCQTKHNFFSIWQQMTYPWTENEFAALGNF